MKQSYLEQISHAQNHLHGINGLREKVCSAGLQRRSLCFRGHVCGENENGKVSAYGFEAGNSFHHFISVHKRHMKVEQDNVGADLME